MTNSLILVLVGIGILDGWADVPIYLGPLVLALASVKPVSNSLKFILGIFVTYVAIGFVVTIVFFELDIYLDDLNRTFMRLWREPTFLENCLQILIGVALVLFGRWMLKRRDRAEEKPIADAADTSRPFLVGATMVVAGLPLAGPYFAVIAQVLRAQLELRPSLRLLVLYSLIYVLPLLCLLALRLVFRQASDAIFERLKVFLDKWAERVVVALLAVLGILLVGDGIMWFFDSSVLRR